jgi:hypothetical protein
MEELVSWRSVNEFRSAAGALGAWLCLLELRVRGAAMTARASRLMRWGGVGVGMPIGRDGGVVRECVL